MLWLAVDIMGETIVRVQGSLKAYHVLGNHCLAAPRDRLLQRLGMPRAYYAADIAPGWRLVTLDTTEMSNHSRYPQVAMYYIALSDGQIAHICNKRLSFRSLCYVGPRIRGMAIHFRYPQAGRYVTKRDENLLVEEIAKLYKGEGGRVWIT